MTVGILGSSVLAQTSATGPVRIPEPWVAALVVSLALLALAEIVLAFVVLAKSKRLLSGKFLAVSLVLHALVVFGGALPFLLQLSPNPPLLDEAQLDAALEETPEVADAILLVAPLIALTLAPFAAATDAAFVATYPSPLGKLARRPWWLALPYAVPVAVTAFFLPRYLQLHQAIGEQALRYFAAVASSPPASRGLLELAKLHQLEVQLSALFLANILLDFLLLVAASGLSAGIFAWRSRRSATTLARRQSRFMLAATAIPVSVASVGLGLYALGWATGSLSRLPQSWYYPLLGSAAGLAVVYVLVPPAAIAYGVLRYRILDLNGQVRRGARLTLSYGALSAIVVAAFFLMSEMAESLLRVRTHSGWLAFAGAAVLAAGLYPLQQRLHRWAREREATGGPARRGAGARPRDIYRAMFEELTSSGLSDDGARSHLRALARTLGLTVSEVSAIERAVGRERTEQRMSSAGLDAAGAAANE